MITEAMVEQAGEQLYTEALIDLPQDVIDRMNEMISLETSELARFQLEKLLENAAYAKEHHKVICQDTGLSSYKVKVGTKAQIEGDLAAALARGTVNATKNIPTIPHSVHPITRENTGNGTGPRVPMITYDLLPGEDYVEIVARPIGGGGDLCSTVKIFTGSTSFKDVEKFIIDVVAEAGCKPCPPMIVGVGLGGMFETVNQLAKEAYSRPIPERNSDPMVAEIEDELLEMVNSLGIGPMGLGGRTTALSVNIEIGNTGTYTTPVAVKIGCWDVHRKIARLYNDGTVTYF